MYQDEEVVQSEVRMKKKKGETVGQIYIWPIKTITTLELYLIRLFQRKHIDLSGGIVRWVIQMASVTRNVIAIDGKVVPAFCSHSSIPSSVSMRAILGISVPLP